MSKPVYFHPMATAPQDGTMVRLRIRPVYAGYPTEVFGSWDGVGWTSDRPIDSSRYIKPIGWAEL